MESITKATIKAMIYRENIPLIPTQSKLCVPVINRIFKKMKVGITVPDIKVFENMICDGHYRYIASLLAKVTLHTVQTHKTTATTATKWPSVIFEDDDWDTPGEIDRFNKQDADYNGIALHKLIEMLN